MSPVPPQYTGVMPAPNYVNPETRGPALIILGTLFLVLSTVAVCLRCFAHISSRKFGVDDICIVLAWVTTLCLTVALDLANARWGANRHLWDLPYSWIEAASKLNWLGKLLVILASSFTRLSLLLFYYRLIENATWLRTFRYILHVAVTATVSIGLITAGMGIAQCRPIRAYWTYPHLPGATCRDDTKELFIASLLYCVCDAVVVTLPIPIIWQLKLSYRKRVEVTMLLTVGFIATAAGCVRTYFLWKLYTTHWDKSWNAYPTYISTCLEVNLGIICACMPQIRGLIKDLLKRFSGPDSKRPSKVDSAVSGVRDRMPTEGNGSQREP